MKYKKIIKIFLCSLLITTYGCNFFDINPDDMLKEEDSYSNLNELYAGFIGMHSTLKSASEYNILVGELLGDLTVPRAIAPSNYWNIWRYKMESDNTLLDPTPYYNVIVNANDFLRHIVSFKHNPDNVIAENMYKGMVSATIAIRAWAYLQIGKFYGEAAYYDLAFTSEIEIKEPKMLQFDDLISELIYFVTNGVDDVDGFNQLDVSSIIEDGDESWNRITINSDALLAELYMWAGDYLQAAKRLTHTLSGAGMVKTGESSTAAWLLGEAFETSKWSNIFSLNLSNVMGEAISAVPYNSSNQQTNPMPSVMSRLMPTDSLVAKFENTARVDKGTGDHRGENASYIKLSKTNEAYIIKYGTNYHNYLYRASELWLMLAEAMSALGDFAASDSLLNVGLLTSYQNSQLQPPFDNPVFTIQSNILRYNKGVRGRAGSVPNYLNDYVLDDDSYERKRFVQDSLIAEEVALELAFEGKRWFSLLRMARNSNMPEKLADQVCIKFPEEEREQYRTYLMNPSNWFIKYNHLNK